jgi:hypothetical protein
MYVVIIAWIFLVNHSRQKMAWNNPSWIRNRLSVVTHYWGNNLDYLLCLYDTKPLCSTRSKALLESVFLITCVLWLEHPGCLIFVLTAKFSSVSMYISFHFIQEQSLPGITSHLTIFANQPQVSKHLPCASIKSLNVVN